MNKLFKALFLTVFSLGLTVSSAYANNQQYDTRENKTQNQQSSKTIRQNSDNDEEESMIMERAVKTPIYKCIQCGGPTGGVYYPLCQWCHWKNGGK